MSWSLLAYAVPLVGGIKTFSAMNPANYRDYEEAPESSHSTIVKQIAERVLSREWQPGEAYQERIQEMVQELPDSVRVKDVAAVVAHRLKVVAISNAICPIHSTGTDVDMGAVQGKFFIGIDPGVEKSTQGALSWIATHEICHILEGDWGEIALIKTIASLSVTILSTVFLGWGLLASASAAIATNVITHAILSHRVENRADDFANQHCSLEERLKAIAYLEDMKRSRPQGGIAAYVKTIIRSAFHPSEDARMANIQGTLGLDETRKTA
jgi:hypothetical protein